MRMRERDHRSIVLVDTEDPLFAAASLFRMEDDTLIALTEPASSRRPAR